MNDSKASKEYPHLIKLRKGEIIEILKDVIESHIGICERQVNDLNNNHLRIIWLKSILNKETP